MKRLKIIFASVIVTILGISGYYAFGSASVNYTAPPTRWLQTDYSPYGTPVTSAITTNNTVFLYRTTVSFPRTIDQLCYTTGNNPPAGSFVMGVYGPASYSAPDTSDGLPLVVQTASTTQSGSSTNTSQCTSVASTTLLPGFYYLAFHTGGGGASVDVANVSPGGSAYPSSIMRRFTQTFGPLPSVIPTTTQLNPGSGGDGTVIMTARVVQP